MTESDGPRPRELAVTWLGRVACVAACLTVIGPTVSDAVRGAPMADFTVYWTAARLWLDGGDPTVFSALQAVAPEPVGGPFAYPGWTLLAFAPWAALPFPIAKALWATLTGLALAVGAAAWVALADTVEVPDEGRRSTEVMRAARAFVVTAVAWRTLRLTVTMGLAAGNLAPLQAAVVPWAALLALRSPSGLGSLGVMTPFILSRWAPVVWAPAWWPRGRGGRPLWMLAACVGAALLLQAALAQDDPWGAILNKMTEALPPSVDHSMSSALQQLGLGLGSALAMSVGLAIVFAASAGRALFVRRDATAIVAWIAATLLFMPRLPDYDWMVLPGVVAFTLLRVRALSVVPLVVALLLPDHDLRPLLISATALWALRTGRGSG